MPDEMEEMEARLAAYIDGALPPHQRAEIEAYLKANPTHAKLIGELQSIKTAVATLPKEKAPAEVLDTLQAHLERHSLLEPADDATEPMFINRWPQLGAVAASVLLAAGLGFLIFQTLPSGKPNARDMALLSSSATRPAEEYDASAAGGVSLEAAAKDGVASAKRPRKAESYFGEIVTPDLQQFNQTQQNQAMPGQQNLPPTSLRANGAEVAAAVAAPAALGLRSLPPSGAVNVLIVTTDDPALTANLVTGGLAIEGVRFERPATGTAALPSTLPSDGPQTLPAVSRIEAITSRLRADGDLPTSATPLPVGPVVVPAASSRTRAIVQGLIDAQRPGRQSWRDATELTDGQPVAIVIKSVETPAGELADSSRFTAAGPVTTQAATPGPTFAVKPAAASPSITASRPATRSLADASTQAATQSAAAVVPPDAPDTADLVLLFVERAATRPTSTIPATRPTSQSSTLPSGVPAVDEIP